MHGNSFPPHGKLYEMNKALVIGNGESRAWFKPCHQQILDRKVITWGCNAIYRDGTVNNLVSVDYGMQQEIYDSGYALDKSGHDDYKLVHFANWSPLPSEVADMMFMGYDIPEAFIHRSKNRTSQCVISGKDPDTLQEKIEVAMRMNPNLDIEDLKLKMEKDVGVWITYVEENDDVVSIDYPVGWSAGNTALHLACQAKPEKVYVMGFDLSSYDNVVPIQHPIGWSTGNTALHLACQDSTSPKPLEVYVLGFDLSAYNQPLNNMYKGTDNYLPADAKGFNPDNWYKQMLTVFKEFPEIDFYLVDHDNQFDSKNVKHITKLELCEELKIV